MDLVVVAAGQQVLAGRQDMHLEGLERIGLVGLPLQRVGLELAAEGHLRVLLVLPDRRWRPLGHGQGIAQGLVRHHVGHQYHGHVPLQRLVHQVQHLRVARIVHAAIGARIEFRHATGKAKQQGGGKGKTRAGQSHASILDRGWCGSSNGPSYWPMPGSQYFKWTRSAGAHRQGQELPRPAGPRWFYAYADLQALGSALSGRPGSGNVHIRKSGNPARIEATPVSSESIQMYQV